MYYNLVAERWLKAMVDKKEKKYLRDNTQLMAEWDCEKKVFKARTGVFS